MEGFTVRYDTIKDYNITKMKPLKGVFYNIRYYTIFIFITISS